MATAAVTLSQSVLSTISSLFQGHVIRARNAQNENQAVAQIIPQWDATFQEIIHAYNTGDCTRDQALQALDLMDQQTQQELHQFVGKPGTSWDNKPAQRCGDPGAAICDKTCTVGCCVYKAYLSRPLDCAFKAIQSGTARTVTRATIQGSKYGLPTFPSYTVQVAVPAPGAGGSLNSIEDALGIGGGSGQSLIGGGYAAPTGTFSTALGHSPNYTALLLLGGGFLLLLLLLSGGRK